MLAPLARPFLATLFGTKIDADCVIRFTLAPETRVFKKQRRASDSAPQLQSAEEQNRCKTDTVKKERNSSAFPAGADVVPESCRQSPGLEKRCVEATCPDAPKKFRTKPLSDASSEYDEDVGLFVGDPIPGHRLVLRCGSERFRAYMERWEPLARKQQQEQQRNQRRKKQLEKQKQGAPFTCCTPARAPDADEGLSADAPFGSDPRNDSCGHHELAGADGTPARLSEPKTLEATPRKAASPDSAPKRKRARPAKAASASSASAAAALSELPEILIPLDSEEDLPAAKRALRFMYSGRVPYTIGFKDILNTRRMAGYLQITGGAEGCDDAMVEKLEVEGAIDSATVLDAWACWLHFPDETAFDRVLMLARRCLVRHFHDALSILNCDPHRADSVHRQFLTLPAPAVEALLAADDFGTDSESSVLLLLSRWLPANCARCPGACARLCRQIRVLHLSAPYLTHVLPQLDWFAATPAERAALTALAGARNSSEWRAVMLSVRANGLNLGPEPNAFRSTSGAGGSAGGGDDVAEHDCRWLAPPRRQCLSPAAGRIFTWSASVAKLRQLCRSVAETPLVSRCWHRCKTTLTAKPPGVAPGFSSAPPPRIEELTVVTAHGLQWKVRLVVSRTDSPYVLLSCDAPMLDQRITDFLDIRTCPLTVTLWPTQPAAGSGATRVPAHILLNGTGIISFGVNSRLELGFKFERMRRAAAANAVGVEPDLMEPWEPYVQTDGTICGELVFKAQKDPKNLPYVYGMHDLQDEGPRLDERGQGADEDWAQHIDEEDDEEEPDEDDERGPGDPGPRQLQEQMGVVLRMFQEYQARNMPR